ncbi:MAG: histidine kinase [Desulfovibrionaceae bacterium]|jgi:two-component system sensor histidine kinase AlgZ|nr:histidine kinase [Desulfovibrionaceae bacterium]
MKDSQILSTLDERGRSPVRARRAPLLVFDACQAGVVLRAVLFVEAVAAIGLMFVTGSVVDWLTRVALLTGGALPATLLWLVAVCSLKMPLARLPWAAQAAAGVALGALAGLAACGILAALDFAGPPPWLASACTGALLAAGIVASLRWRARGSTPAATAARLAELQARIRPHFLFNALNSAIALVRDEPDKAESVLEDLADLFRHALTEQEGSSTVGQEIDLARRYLAIEQVRFGKRLRVEWALDERVNAARLPPLILQPLIENAVKHGVEPSPSGAQVRVSTQLRRQMALIKVTNTVPAGQGQAGLGLALQNVRDRLRLLHDLEGGFRTALREGIYQARIEVPMK